MVAQHYKYVFLGGGQGAGYAAREFVSRGLQPGELLIITAEKVVSYERPTLSKGYLKPEGAPRLPGFHSCVGGGGEKQLPEWYKEKGIEYRLNTLVTDLNVKSKTVTTENGDKVTYDKLIIATGCSVIKLDAFGAKNTHLNHIYYLRDVQDADALVAGLSAAKAKGDAAVVVGGGYIGMEVTANLVAHGYKVTMVYPEPHLMQRLFTPEMAAVYEQYYKRQGVTLSPGNTATGFVDAGDGSVSAVELKSGEKVPANVVVVGVGAKPNVDLAKGQLEVLQDRPGGIKVDEHLRTSDPDVYAVGDVAAFPLALYGGKVTRQEHVTHARLSAAHAAAHITTGGDGMKPYTYLPYFYSREFDLGWKFYGESEGESVMWGNPEAVKFGAYWVQDGKVVGAFQEGGSDAEGAMLARVAQLRPPAPALDELRHEGIKFAEKV